MLNILAFCTVFILIVEVSFTHFLELDRNSNRTIVLLAGYALLSFSIAVGPVWRWYSFFAAANQENQEASRLQLPNPRQDSLMRACRSFFYMSRDAVDVEFYQDMVDRYQAIEEHLLDQTARGSQLHNPGQGQALLGTGSPNQWATHTVLDEG